MSFNLDPSCNRGFHHTNFTNPNLRAAATFLSPARLRFGGSGADYLVYGLTAGSPECAAVPAAPPPDAPGCDYITPGCLNGTHLSALLDLGEAAGADFLFGVAFNGSAFCAGGAWDAANAARLLAFLRDSGRSMWGFEVGNEVNNAGCEGAAAAQAAAVGALARMLADSSVPAARLVGPDTGYLDPVPFLTAFARAVAPGALSALTHHVYLGLERRDFASAAALAARLDSAAAVAANFSALAAAVAPGAEAWAGEMGPIGGGDDGTCGPNSTCGTFASALWYADDAGMRARAGYAQHQRQDLFGGHYGLVASASGAMALDAAERVLIAPDYWVAWLFKRTMGTGVLTATASAPSVRAYAFAGKPPSPFAARAHCGGAGLPQLLILNADKGAADVALPAAPGARAFAAWVLAPAGGDPFALAATLNGAPLALAIDVEQQSPAQFLGFINQPPVNGTLATDTLALPAYAIAFVCLL